MKNKIILHIGHPKTGSSYLQSCFALNRDKLLELGIDYPWHESFSSAQRGNFTSGNGKTFLDALPNLKAKGDKALFSNEGLFRSLIASPKFFELLKSGNYSFEVVMYTRNLFDHLFSRWAQLVKSRKSIDDINTYLRKAPNGPYEKILGWIIASQRREVH